jgi:hypothetical protein
MSIQDAELVDGYGKGVACTRFGRHSPKLIPMHLEFHGAFVADCPVSAFSIVEAFDVIEHVSLGFVTPIFYSSRPSTWHKLLILFGVG